MWDGGIQSFPVNRERVRGMCYCVIVRNQHGPHEAEDGLPHGDAFLIGLISNVVPSTDPGVRVEEAKPDFKGRHRSLIRFSHYARLTGLHDIWAIHGSRYSAQYRRLSDLGIDVSKLDWQPMPSETELASSWADPRALDERTIDEGKGTEELEPTAARQVVPSPVAQNGALSFTEVRALVESTKVDLAARIGIDPKQVVIDIRL